MSQFRRELLIVFGMFAAMLCLSARQLRNEVWLSQHTQQVQAIVVSTQSHAWIGYTYLVNGITHEGATPAAATGKPIDKVQLGDTFIIAYDPNHPDVSGTAKTREVIASTIPFLVFGLVVAVGIVFARNFARLRSAA